MTVPERTLSLALNTFTLNDPCLGEEVTETAGRLEESDPKTHLSHLPHGI